MQSASCAIRWCLDIVADDGQDPQNFMCRVAGGDVGDDRDDVFIREECQERIFASSSCYDAIGVVLTVTQIDRLMLNCLSTVSPPASMTTTLSVWLKWFHSEDAFDTISGEHKHQHGHLDDRIG